MNLVVRTTDGDCDVVVEVDDPTATVADLVTAVGLPDTPGVDVDDRYVPSDTSLADAGLSDGSVVTAAHPHGPPWQPRPACAWVTIAAGPRTGERLALRPNVTVVVGRDDDCDVVVPSGTVSGRHAMITMTGDGLVVVEDAGSRNGTWVDGDSIHGPTRVEPGAVLRLGGVVVAITPPDPEDRPSGATRAAGIGGSLPFNRKPRAALPERAGVLDVPGREEPSTASRTFRAAALVSPVLMGAFMVLRTGDIRYAGFAVVSPIAMLAMWIADRRRVHREGMASAADFEHAVEEFRVAVGSAWDQQRRRLEQVAPAMGEVLRRSLGPSTRLWERRLGHPDALRLRVGSADLPWRPPLRIDGSRPPSHDEGTATTHTGDGLDPEVRAVLHARRHLPNAPVTVDLLATDDDRGAGDSHPSARAGVVGIVGDDDGARALARALLVQATTFHGPADLRTVILTSPRHVAEWEWAKWLPHARAPDGSARLLGDRHNVSTALVDGLLASLEEARDDGFTTPAGDTRPPGTLPLLVVDDLSLLRGRDAAARRLLAGAGGPATGIVVADTVDQLPASCEVVVRVAPDGLTGEVTWPATGARHDEVILAGLDVDRARSCARAMARWDDPELPARGSEVPDMVRLLPLLGMADVAADTVLARWRQADVDPGAPATLGAGAKGAVTLDMPVDGPHGLVGGTTGAGKSELLRSMIASMAAQVDPDHIVFVLVDYKGGSTFDLCAQLPHTVGLVTDLDEHLGERALVSLEAELHRREGILREAEAQDLPAYLDLGSPAGPMPRLVVVIDEFATMAAELPDFLGALVGIAQRGRSLGVHLVLATQRPRGAVDANVRANTNLRIALRMQDPGDSTDIIDVPDAATLPRDKPGRAWIRRGHGDLELVQSALSTAGAPSSATPLRVVPFRFTPEASLPSQPLSGPSDLARLVEACRQAFDASGSVPPRKPWLPMPPRHLDLDEVLGRPDQPDGVVIGLEDVPELQAQDPFAWQPRDGHLGLFGMVGQGTTTALLAVATSIAATQDADTVHLYGLDFGGGGLRQLDALPHVGAIVEGGDVQRQARLMTWLTDEIAIRRAMDPDDRDELPTIVVLVDKVAGFLAEHAEVATRSVGDDFQQVVKEGPAVGIVMAITGEATRDLPTRLQSQVATTLRFKVADTAVGSGTSGVPALAPGRAWEASAEHVVQVGLPLDVADLAETLAPATRHVPDPVAVVPESLPSERLQVVRHDGTGPLSLPIGMSAEDMSSAHLRLHPGDHAAVIGPPRSGKSSLLRTISAQLRLHVPDSVQLGLCDPDRSPLAGWPSLDGHGTVDELAEYLSLGTTVAGCWVVLVDDAGRLAGNGTLATLVAARPDLHVIAAGRTGDMRGGYGDWLRTLRASRTGVLLQPDLPMDGDLLSARLPRRVTTPLVVGRGFVVNAGAHTLVQTARPPGQPPPGGLADA